MLLLACLGFVMTRRMYRRVGSDQSQERNRDGSFPYVCSHCGDETLVEPESLHTLSSAEKALVVRAQRQALGKNLVEYVCRQCDASHCFAMSGVIAEYIGVNLYQGQQIGSRCAECQRALARPTWEPGEYDGRITEAPGTLEAQGLRCRHCGALTCVSCCRSVTRNRTPDGSLLCPRCFRGPQDRFYHP